MKKKTVTLFVIVYCFTINLFAEESIEIPFGNPINIDGGFSYNEWSEADSIKINLQTGPKITVFYKHDNTNLYLAYCSNIYSLYNVRCPEALFDINNDKSNEWMNDDWWFHVSATDCYSQGKYGDYSTCKLVQPDWEANNLVDSNFRDTIEVIIPFTTLGIETNGVVKTGICFLGTDTHNMWEYWPIGANKSNPNTWAEATIDFNTSAIETPEQNNNLSIIPNPATNTLQITGELIKNSKISIFNDLGIEIQKMDYRELIDVSFLTSGIYFLRFEKKNQTIIREFVIVK